MQVRDEERMNDLDDTIGLTADLLKAVTVLVEDYVEKYVDIPLEMRILNMKSDEERESYIINHIIDQMHDIRTNLIKVRDERKAPPQGNAAGTGCSRIINSIP